MKKIDIIEVAKRCNNSKRSYLLVNRIQAKHIPTIPSKALELFEQLGRKIYLKYPGAKLVIGFAETATALGLQTAVSMGSDTYFLSTTREPHISDDDCLFFSEEHSHASKQKLYISGLKELIDKTNELVLVDDEISTGKTLYNIVSVLRSKFPELNERKIIVGSILNRLTSERKKEFASKNIFFESVYEMECENDDINLNFEFIKEPDNRFYNSSYQYVYERYTTTFMDPRMPVNVGSYLKNCGEIYSFINKRIPLGEYKSLLVLGTEKNMYPAIYIALRIEKEYPVDVRCYSTTRSPICTGTEPYPITNGYLIHSLYNANRINYIYNLSKYDTAIIISDSKNPSNQAIQTLNVLLSHYGIKNIFYIVGE